MKIFTIIQELSPETFKSFRLFLKSPFHNSNKRLLKMLEVRGAKNLDPEALHQRLFPGESFNKQVFKNLGSEMLKKYKKFLAISLVDSNEDLLDALTYRKIKEEGLEKELGVNLAPLKSYDFLSTSLLTFQVRGELANSYMQSLLDKKNLIGGINDLLGKEFLLQMTNALVTKIKFYCNYIFLKRRFSGFIKIDFLEKEMTLFQIPEYLKSSVLLDLYFRGFKLVQYPEQTTYFELGQLFKIHVGNLHKDHFQFILAVLSNYCVGKLNTGDASFSKDMFEIGKINLKYTKEKVIPYNSLTNFAVAGCRIGKQKEVLAFMVANKKRTSDDSFNYNMGLIKNYEKDYAKSLYYLRQVGFEKIFFSLNTRHLIIRNLVALDELEVALNNIESLKVYILRSKNILATRRKTNLNFLKYFKACILTKNKIKLISSDKYEKSIEALKFKILNQKNLFTKEYLIAYLEEESKLKLK